MKELDKTYSSGIEERIYKKWLDKNYFHADVNTDKTPFCIVMPPPNITGHLHMGHALDNTMQDIIIRYKRMQGFETLWQPGTDHAAIATEVKVIDKLKAQGKDKNAIGREAFLKEAWDWKEEYGSKIIKQLHRLGCSADWERERFTMDEGCSDAVLEFFIRLYEKGYIYKGSRIINWCPVCKTSISDAEVLHDESEGNFWYIKYPVADMEGEYVEIATTRPETMLGDSAVAVNPHDKRYLHLVGKMLRLPLSDRTIPVIADDYVDMEFGTGCVKITPAHDPNDFEVGKRHKLAEINIFNDDATIDLPGSKYDGMDRYAARKEIVADLEKAGLLVKVKPHLHNAGTHDRCKTVVEPMIKPQWFVRMDELAKPAIKVIEDNKLKFVPESFSKTYLHWLENIKDWCISRQLWWGHRIPAYYCNECGKITVAKKEPEQCSCCGKKAGFMRDEDTLDTWFSSALWPFSTLGWPDKTPEYDYFYPTDVLVTGYDIIFFWVVRMVFSALDETGKVPFDTVLIHGLVRDSQGRKMSKSLGNGIDPLEVIDKYGADALRMTLITGNAPGNDMRFYFERVEASRNFANKIWNASRFIMMNMSHIDTEHKIPDTLKTEDKWILSKTNSLVKEVSDNLDKYELGIALGKLYDFTWEEFCDWYIEMVKPRLREREKDGISADSALWTLKTVLSDLLKLLHPFMPFVTEEIFCNLNNLSEDESIMVSRWPVYDEKLNFKTDEASVEVLKEAVRKVRNIRASKNVPASKKTAVYIVSDDNKHLDIFKESEGIFKHLAYASEVVLKNSAENLEKGCIMAVLAGINIYMPLAQLVDIAEEKQRLKKEEGKILNEIHRAESMLVNEKFTLKAPAAKVEEEKVKLEKYKGMLGQVKEQLAQLESI